MEEISNIYALITDDDISEINLEEIDPEQLTEVHGLGTGLKAAKAGSYAGSAAANI